MSHSKHPRLLKGLAVLTGVIIGAAGVLFYKENKTKRPSQVLEQVRQQLAQHGIIEGSWIHYQPIEYTAIDSQPLVYIGGISRLEAGHVVHYQFASDIYTGEILDIYPL